MSNIQVKSVTKGEPPCPSPAPRPEPKRICQTDAPKPFPPPPPFFMPGPCCPGTTQVVDNITVVSLSPDTIEVTEGTINGQKAFGIASAGALAQTVVAAGENVTVDVEEIPGRKTYTVNANAKPVNVSAGQNVNIVKTESSSAVDFQVNANQAPLSLDGNVLYGDGTPEHPLGVHEFTGATTNDNGTSGVVPAPTSSDANKFLKGDGTWGTAGGEVVAGQNITVTKTTGANGDTFTVSANTFTGATASENGTSGVVPAPSSADRNKFLRGDGTWTAPDESYIPIACDTQTMDNWLDAVDQEVEVNGNGD